jgi:hypothetical protein
MFRAQPTGGGRVEDVSAAFAALLEEIRAGERKLLDADPALPEPDLLDGYRWLFSLLSVALDAYVWADTDRPRFVDIVGPNRKWGGDNADAFYQYAAIDPNRTYRVRGRRGDAAYLSLTVYGGPNDGHYSERIVGTVNDRALTFDEAGRFEIVLGAEQPEASTAWIELQPDAVCAITRDYLADPRTGRRATWEVEAVGAPATLPAARRTSADLSRRFTAARTWLAEQIAMCPIRIDPPNELQEPYPVPATTFGWAAGDAAYAMGSFALDAGEALVIEGASPECAFWNLCLWNPFLHTYDYGYERVTINGEQVVTEPDGSWRIVVADGDPGHPNWVSTQGRRSGLLWFRWFLPVTTPTRPLCSVVAVDAVPGANRSAQ